MINVHNEMVNEGEKGFGPMLDVSATDIEDAENAEAGKNTCERHRLVPDQV